MNKRPSMYSRPDKPLYVPVPKRDWRERTVTAEALAQPVTVHAATECHVTPAHIAGRMAALLGELTGVDVLEPSAGTGNLARAVLAAGADPGRLVMVELHCQLAAGLCSIGPVENRDFLEWTSEHSNRRFGRIIMNPPFSRVRAHMSAARSLLAPAGVLVALVPVTYSAPGFEDVDLLPPDTFSTAKVHTKIIRFEG